MGIKRKNLRVKPISYSDLLPGRILVICRFLLICSLLPLPLHPHCHAPTHVHPRTPRSQFPFTKKQGSDKPHAIPMYPCGKNVGLLK